MKKLQEYFPHVNRPLFLARRSDLLANCCNRNRVGKLGAEGLIRCANCGAERGQLDTDTLGFIAAVDRVFGISTNDMLVVRGEQ